RHAAAVAPTFFGRLAAATMIHTRVWLVADFHGRPGERDAPSENHIGNHHPPTPQKLAAHHPWPSGKHPLTKSPKKKPTHVPNCLRRDEIRESPYRQCTDLSQVVDGRYVDCLEI